MCTKFLTKDKTDPNPMRKLPASFESFELGSLLDTEEQVLVAGRDSLALGHASGIRFEHIRREIENQFEVYSFQAKVRQNIVN
jgi:hypothetical protein